MAVTRVKLSNNNVEYTKQINDNFSDLEQNKVAVEAGKGLSTKDFTAAYETKLTGIEASAQVNKIEVIKVNNTAQTISSKTVNITVPTKTSDLTNDSNFVNQTALDAKLSKVSTASKVYGTDSTGAQTTYSVSDFGQVNTVNNVSPDNNKNITLAASDINDGGQTVSAKLSALSTSLTTDETKLSGIESGAQVNKIETIKVNNTALTITNKTVNITIPAQAEYTIAEVTTTSGYAKSYRLTKDGTAIGATINIPKDLVVSSGEVKTVTTADVPYQGAVVGDKYIDLTLNDVSANHIYIPVKDLVDVYTAGNGIDVNASNIISLKLDSNNLNGLSVGASGLALAVATTSAAGAMSSNDKTKLDGIAASAQVNKIEKIKVNGTQQTISSKTVDITVPTKLTDLTNDGNFVTDASYVHTDVNFTSAKDTKLTGIETGAQVNKIETIKFNGTTVSISNKSVNIQYSGVDSIKYSSTSLKGNVEFVAGQNISITPDSTNNTVTISSTIPASTLLQTITFTASDAGWSAVDSDGNYTLTIANTGTALAVQKSVTGGGYETVMANLRYNGTNFYVVSDAKFAGKIIYFGS